MAIGTGKWGEAGVPHKGWTCLDIEDLKEQMHLCEMCETQYVRYVHVMTHPDYDGELRVGCVCAGHMEQDLATARKREADYKNIALRRQNWLRRQWRISDAGNAYLNTDGFRIVVYRKDTNWGATITHRSSGYQRQSQRPYASSDLAKLATFDAMIDLKRRRPWR